MKDRDELRQLLEKYLSGKYTAEELDTLLEHFQGKDSSKTLEELTEAYLNRIEVSGQTNERVQKLLSNTDQAIRQAVPLPTTSKKRNYRWWYAAAAVLACVSIGIGLYLRQQALSDMPVLTSVYGDDVLPGGNRATLTLANGKTISLSESKHGVVVQSNELLYDDGTQISSVSRTTSEYVTLTTPNGGQYQITLQDGSKIWLNAASSIRYPVTFAANERKVEMTGEAYFEVIKNENQPFIVQSGEQSVKVLGTSFNIHAYGGAAITTLLTGRVEVKGENIQTTSLRPGEQSLWKGSRFTVRTVDTQEAVAWKKGLIAGNEISLDDIIPQIERWYNVDFRWDGSIQNKEKAYISISKSEKLSAVLEAIELIYGVHFTVKGKEVVIEK